MKRIIKSPLCISVLVVLLIFLSGCSNSSNADADGNNSTATVFPTLTPTPTPDNRIEVIDVVNTSLPEAKEKLTDAGFLSITDNTSSDPNWDADRWLVVSQSPQAGEMVLPESTIVLTCKKKCYLYVDVKSNANWFFDKYDLELYLDGTRIGNVANGREYTHLSELVDGQHTFIVYKSGDHSVSGQQTFDVDGDMTFISNISHGDEITFENTTFENNIDRASLEIPNVIGQSLSAAEESLSKTGFINLYYSTKNDENVWISDNWRVYSLDPSPGTTTDMTTNVIMYCEKYDTYYNNRYAGKKLVEAQALAKEDNTTLYYSDIDGNDINEYIASLSRSQKDKCTVEKAIKYSAGTAKLYIADAKPTPTPKPTPTATVSEKANNTQSSPQTNQESDHPSYSTNSNETVADGNTGIYAYSSLNNGQYDNYIIIDFDEGYVYFFSDGNGSGTCDKVKIDSGDLNDKVMVTYHDVDGSTWQEGLHWKYQRVPVHLVLEDFNHFEYDYGTTDLEHALKIRDEKRIVDY